MYKAMNSAKKTYMTPTAEIFRVAFEAGFLTESLLASGGNSSTEIYDIDSI